MSFTHQDPDPKELSIALFDLGYWESYKQVWDFQKQRVKGRIDDSEPNSLILVEHAHVLTLGRNGKRENILGGRLPVFEVERGGDVTYHGPGQLVAYPILSLRDFSLGIKEYVVLLEEVLTKTLDRFGIQSQGKLGAETGVWVGGSRKIASIGIATSHWITFHGVALNVTTDLSYFENIRPCGFESSVMTSMEKEIGASVKMSEVKKEFVSCFQKQFGAAVFPTEIQNDFKT